MGWGLPSHSPLQTISCLDKQKAMEQMSDICSPNWCNSSSLYLQEQSVCNAILQFHKHFNPHKEAGPPLIPSQLHTLQREDEKSGGLWELVKPELSGGAWSALGSSGRVGSVGLQSDVVLAEQSSSPWSSLGSAYASVTEHDDIILLSCGGWAQHPQF